LRDKGIGGVTQHEDGSFTQKFGALEMKGERT